MALAEQRATTGSTREFFASKQDRERFNSSETDIKKAQNSVSSSGTNQEGPHFHHYRVESYNPGLREENSKHVEFSFDEQEFLMKLLGGNDPNYEENENHVSEIAHSPSTVAPYKPLTSVTPQSHVGNQKLNSSSDLYYEVYDEYTYSDNDFVESQPSKPQLNEGKSHDSNKSSEYQEYEYKEYKDEDYYIENDDYIKEMDEKTDKNEEIEE